jgi:putative sugar O-methyltransferase
MTLPTNQEAAIVDTSLEARIEALRRSPAYGAYQRARENVIRFKTAEPANGGRPSEYWREELENIAYLFDASPLVIDRLRQHCYHVTGTWPYNYRSHKDRERARHAAKLEALIEVGGSDLVVPESPLLGGFGFDLEAGSTRGFFNIDTLKYLEVLVALDRAYILDEFRTATDRRIVWEIGAGWGGFAYQFKTLFPNTTYLIVDLPELFLFSATYLAAAFPDARVAFWGESGDGAPWLDADFVFVPNTALAELDPPRLDMTINMVSFQEMTTAQVAEYVRTAAELECPFLYSLNRERSLYNPELTSVTEIIAQHYWPNRIEVLPVSYVKLPDEIPTVSPKAKSKAGERGANDYEHVVGWRRILR